MTEIKKVKIKNIYIHITIHSPYDTKINCKSKYAKEKKTENHKVKNIMY